MPITAVAVSPAGSSSVNKQEQKDVFRLRAFDLRLNVCDVNDSDWRRHTVAFTEKPNVLIPSQHTKSKMFGK